MPLSYRKPTQVEGAITGITHVARSTVDPQVWHRALSLWIICSSIGSLTGGLIIRDWFFVAWSLALLLVGSWLCSIYWRMGDSTQYIHIERWVNEARE